MGGRLSIFTLFGYERSASLQAIHLEVVIDNTGITLNSDTLAAQCVVSST